MAHLPLREIGKGRSEQLERIAEAGLVAQGRVFLLSLDVIKLELGPRWRMREELVWETFLRDLTRALPAPDQFVRLNDVTILAAISSTDTYSGQVCCAQVFRETLAFFLGRTLDSDLAMSRVSELTKEGATSEPIDPSLPAPVVRDQEAAQPASPEAWRPPLSSRASSLAFLTERDGPVSLELSVSPVWRLDRRLVAAYAIRRRLPRPLDSFSDRDKEAIDLCVADFLEPIMRDYQHSGGAFAMICPFTFATVSTRSTRLRLMHRCAEFIELMRQAVVLIVDGVNVGCPDGRLRETSAMCQPMARLVTLAIDDPMATDRLCGDHGAQGVAIEADSLTERQVLAMARRLRGRQSNVVVNGVPRNWDIGRLAAVGVSHVTERLNSVGGDAQGEPAAA